MKVKGKLPDSHKNKQKNKGTAILKRKCAPIQPKKAKFEESHKLKKAISKTVNKKMEEEIRSRALDRKTTLSKAQEAMIAHNAAKTAAATTS